MKLYIILLILFLIFSTVFLLKKRMELRKYHIATAPFLSKIEGKKALLRKSVNYPYFIRNGIKNSDILKLTTNYFKNNFSEKMVKIMKVYSKFEDKYPETKTVKLGKFIETQPTDYYLKAEDDYQFLQELGLENSIYELFESEIGKNGIYRSLSFWMGFDQTKTSLHYDTDYYNVLGVIEGEKEVFFIHPKERENIYQMKRSYPGSSWSYVDLWDPDYQKYPFFKKVKIMKITLKRGDLLFIPPYWWHAVRNKGKTVAFTYHYYTFASIFAFGWL